MKINKTKLEGVYIIEPKVFADQRGFFLEYYNQKDFQAADIDIAFVQDNHSKSAKNTLRGLHYQIPPMAQDKLVRCIQGEVFDVAVDLRKNSPTFGQWVGEILSAENKKQMLITKGFAHGFCVLSDTAEFTYKCSNFYSPEHDRAILWNDPEIKINWPIKGAPLLSGKDSQASLLKNILDTF